MSTGMLAIVVINLLRSNLEVHFVCHCYFISVNEYAFSYPEIIEATKCNEIPSENLHLATRYCLACE